jgi:hypothetical protein
MWKAENTSPNILKILHHNKNHPEKQVSMEEWVSKQGDDKLHTGAQSAAALDK